MSLPSPGPATIDPARITPPYGDPVVRFRREWKQPLADFVGRKASEPLGEETGVVHRSRSVPGRVGRSTGRVEP